MRPKGYTNKYFINSIFQHGWNVISQFLYKQIKSLINHGLSHHLGIKQESKNSPLNMRTKNGKVNHVRYQIEISKNKFQSLNLCNSEGKQKWNVASLLWLERSCQRWVLTRQCFTEHIIQPVELHNLSRGHIKMWNRVHFYYYKFTLVNNIWACVECKLWALVSYLLFSDNCPFSFPDSTNSCNFEWTTA